MPTPGLSIGTTAPAFHLPSLDGDDVVLADLARQGGDIVLIFSDAGCGTCTALLPEIGRWQREHPHLTATLVSSGVPDAIRAGTAGHGLRNVLLDADRAIARSFRARGTPSAVLVRANRTVGSHIASGPNAIEALLDAAIPPHPQIPVPIGAPAPESGLPETWRRTTGMAFSAHAG